MQKKMRSGGYTFQQALTQDASSMVKQAVILARRRGHAQVTPLHVAQAMLSTSSGLLRTACLQSHSHPFQCRTLELCFNVALNRLPTCTSSSMLGLHPLQPTFSNALIAAFKRAQAHQRRASVENQQQPVMVVKIELEQLIISILDDPGVSRIMREAGFSSTIVKGKVEQALPMGTQPPNGAKSKDPSSDHITEKGILKPISIPHQAKDEDIAILVKSLVSSRRKRSIVILGDCTFSSESVVRGMMDKLEKGEVPENLRGVKFVQISLYSFGHLKREEIDQKLGELRCLVKGCLENGINKGVILYVGDLKWAKQLRSSYCPIGHMVVELSRMVSSYGEKERIWLLGIATFQTYMRCRNGENPYSLESIWGLHAITFPADGLALSLRPDSVLENDSLMGSKNRPYWLTQLEGGGHKEMHDSLANLDIESSRSPQSSNSKVASSNLPSWLQDHKAHEIMIRSLGTDQDPVPIHDICRKWNSISKSTLEIGPQCLQRTMSFCSSTFGFSHDQLQYFNSHGINQSCPMPSLTRIWNTESSNKTIEPNVTMCIHEEHKHIKSTSFPFTSPTTSNSTPNSSSSCDITEIESTCCQNFNEYNEENLKVISDALEKRVPWQREIIGEIARCVLGCRSERRSREGYEVRHDTWLLFKGTDMHGKEKIAKELARLVFGSERKYEWISLSEFSSSTRTDSSSEESRNKRVRDEQTCRYEMRLAEAMARDPHRVFFLEEFESVDYCSQNIIKKSIERGKFVRSGGEDIMFDDSIVVLSSRSRGCSPSSNCKKKMMEEETSICASLDLNTCVYDEDQFVDEAGIAGYVDGCIMFKVNEVYMSE